MATYALLRPHSACCALLIATVASGAAAAQAQKLSQVDLLNRMIAIEQLPRAPAPGDKAGVSSAAPDSGAAARIWADLRGPGVLTRLWFEQADGTLQIEIDGKVVVDAPLANLFNGQLEPFGEPLSYRSAADGAFVSYFPIGFSQSCKVLTLDAPTTRGSVEYRTFEAGAQIEPFALQLSDDARSALKRVADAFKRGLSETQLGGARPLMTVAADGVLTGKEKISQAVEGAGTIRAIYVGLTDPQPPASLYTLHRCVLRLYWDGAKQPAIEAPLTEFFGAGYERETVNGLLAGTFRFLDLPVERDEHAFFFYSFYPMPFSKGARLEIESLNPARGLKFGVMVLLKVDRTPPASDMLRLRARFFRQDPCRAAEFPILETKGRGRWVGCVLNADTPRDAWWGAGPHSITLDGQALNGAGVADYFGDTPRLRVFSRALHGVTRAAPYGKSSLYRIHLHDSLPYQEGLRFTLANEQPGAARDVGFSALALWYGDAAVSKLAPIKPEDVTPSGLRIPGAFEVEGNIRSPQWGNEVQEAYAGGAEFSGGVAARIATDKQIQMRLVSERAQRVKLLLRVQPGRPFETVSVTTVDGRPVGSIAYQRGSSGLYAVGEVQLAAGETLLNVTCTKPVTLDCWVLQPVK